MRELVQQEIEKKLNASKKRRVPVENLIIVAKSILPHDSDFQVMTRLLDILETLEKEKSIKDFPRKGKGWDRVNGLPTIVTVLRQEEDERKKKDKEKTEELRNNIAWVPGMLPVVSGLKKDQLHLAEKINNYFKTRKEEDAVLIPHRERALQVFGDEKALDKFVRSGLLGGKILFQDLDCFYCTEPLTFEPLGFDTVYTCGKPLLVVENSSTYWSCCSVNRKTGTFAAIIYGKGFKMSNAETVCVGMRQVEERLQSDGIFYFGDLDPKGLEIPSVINEHLQNSGRPKMEAALPLYQLLIEIGVSSKYETEQNFINHKSFAKLWLGTKLSEIYLPQVLEKKRWAQEWLTAKDIHSAFGKMLVTKKSER